MSTNRVGRRGFFASRGFQHLQRRGLNKLLMSNVPFWFVFDFGLVLGAFYLASLLGRETYLASVRYENFLGALVFASCFCLMGLGAGFFEPESRVVRLKALRSALVAWAGAIFVSVTAIYFVFFIQIGRVALVAGSVASLLGVLALHLPLVAYLRRFPLRFVILGEFTPLSAQIFDLLGSDRFTSGYEHLGTVREALLQKLHLNQATEDDLSELAQAEVLNDVVMSSKAAEDPSVMALAMFAMQRGIRVVNEATFFSELTRRYPLEYLDLNWVLHSGIDSQNPMRNLAKRLTDLILSACGLLLLLPVFIVIGLAIRLSDGGPVFFRQQRQGRFSVPFEMIKFRSMTVPHKTSERTELAHSVSDQRITKVGRWLRPWHLDELPQLWNVLRGDMSLVGPRPEALDIVNRVRALVPIFEVRHMLRPGITGHAQLHQGKTADASEELLRKLSYDLYYLKHYGPAFDLFLLLRTMFLLVKKSW